MTKDEALAAALDRAVDDPHGWGTADCNLIPANWVVEAMDVDPAQAWRGRYRSARGAARIVRDAGGLDALWIRSAISVGLVETARPIAGDVGLVRTRCVSGTPRILDGLVGAICIGGGAWAVKTERGLVTDRFLLTRAWRVKWRTR